MSGTAWKPAKLGDALELCLDPVPTDATATYPIGGVYSFGRGLFKREPLSGANTTYKSFNRLHAGNIVISQLKAWEGAIALIPDEFEGWYLSPQFPTFRVQDGIADIRYISWFCRRASFWNQLNRGSRGMGARRNSVSPKQFLSSEMPLPPLSEQQRVVARVELIVAKLTEVKRLQHDVAVATASALQSEFRRLICGAARRPMCEVAPVVRRSVQVVMDESYPELGIRSFGKGTFHKPALTGAAIGSKKLYAIFPGDLVFNNVFAWEGAVAVAKAEDSGRVGSHRFITCVPDPGRATAEFIRFFFLTREGLEALGKASPGGAGRNRTLGLTKLEKIEVPVPPFKDQQRLDGLQAKIDCVKRLQQEAKVKLDALLPSILDRAFKGEL